MPSRLAAHLPAFILAVALSAPALAQQGARLTVVSGAGQTMPIHGQLRDEVILRLTAADGTPMAGRKVTVTSPQTGPQVKFSDFAVWIPYATPITDANGIVRLPMVLSVWGVGTASIGARYEGPEETAETSIPFTTTFKDGTVFGSYQDMWWQSRENGWGIAITQHDDRLFSVVFDYDAAGQPTWHVMPAGAWKYGFGSWFQAPVYSTSGSPYWAYDASRFNATPVAADGGFIFNAKDTGTLVGTFPELRVQKFVERFDFARAPASPITGVGDMWWGGPSQNGWGIAILERPGALFMVWFTYGDDGRPTWFLMSEGQWSDATTWTGPIFTTTSSPWIAPTYDPSKLRVTQVGQFTLRFSGTAAASFRYEIGSRQGTMPLQRFGF